MARAIGAAGVEAAETDDELVRRTGAGDERAFAALIDRHGNRIAALARRMLGPSGDIDDVVQDAFVRLWSQAPAWKPGGAKISTWLYRVAANLCIDRLRKPAAAQLDGTIDPPDPRPLADQALAADAAARRVDEALQGLAPRQRLAIVLCHFEEMGNVEAAESMGLTVEALESLLSRGRRALREALAGEGQSLIAVLSDGGMREGREAGNG